MTDDAGASTVEAALGLVTLVTMAVLCLAGVAAVSMQVRCVDAAREAARLAARGDEPAAIGVARRIAPGDAVLQLHRDGDFMVATVTARPSLLQLPAITAVGISAVEPSR